jgi:hypothetical protein
MFEWIIALTLAQEPARKSPERECVRWSWTGDVYNRKVVCIQWRKKENKWIRSPSLP